MGSWITALKSLISPSSPENKSLKRKRSPAPKINSFHNPILLDSNEEDEIIEDSEDERQEELARRKSPIFIKPTVYDLGSTTGRSC